MTPLTEHQLLIFWLQLVVLLATARALGGLMRRVGQPPVIGELAAGLLIGPSLLGRVAPGVFEFLFPVDPVQSGLLLAVAWVGVALLLVITGFETDLELLSHLGRSSALVATGSLVIPLLLGFALGWVAPALLIGAAGERTTFAMFMAVALAISALPVIAKILIDLNVMRRNIGQVTVAAGMANDLVGWILLGVIAGVVTGGGFAPGRLLLTIAAIGAFLAVALTVGQRLTDAALRRARQTEVPLTSSFTVLLLATLAAGAVTQALGVEAVLGAFVAGIVLGRSRYRLRGVEHSLSVFVNGFFAPLFFATAGLSVDLGLLLDPTTATWALIVLVVAAVAKLGGSYLGARVGGMTSMEGVAVGVGLNARGALEIIVATIGLSLGVLNTTSYTIVVVMAMATSMMAPPLLRATLRRITASPDEAARLDREAMLERSVIAGTRTALLPTRGGENSVLAARLLDLALQPDTAVTVFTVHPPDEPPDRAHAAAAEVTAVFRHRATDRLDRPTHDTVEAICREAGLGYGLVGLGMSEDFSASSLLRDILARCPAPMLLVKHGGDVDPRRPLAFRRILVPTSGTDVARAAQEIAFTLAASTDAEVDVVHVINRPDRVAGAEELVSPSGPQGGTVAALLGEAQGLARQYGRTARVLTRVGPSVGAELSATAEETGADLLVLAAQVRSYGGQPFLGHGVEYLLEHTDRTVAVVVFPPPQAEPG